MGKWYVVALNLAAYQLLRLESRHEMAAFFRRIVEKPTTNELEEQEAN